MFGSRILLFYLKPITPYSTAYAWQPVLV